MTEGCVGLHAHYPRITLGGHNANWAVIDRLELYRPRLWLSTRAMSYGQRKFAPLFVAILVLLLDVPIGSANVFMGESPTLNQNKTVDLSLIHISEPTRRCAR